MRNLEHTIDVLAKAYLSRHFRPMNFCCCTVGNIVADANEYKIHVDDEGQYWWLDDCGDIQHQHWSNVFFFGKLCDHVSDEMFEKAETEIRPTGYTLDELMLLERTMFEAINEEIGWDFKNCYNSFSEERLDELHFTGLMAVVDTLYEIHNVDNEEHKEQSKQKFVLSD